MDRRTWARVAALPVALGMAATLAGCGGGESAKAGPPADKPGKRLPDKGVCDVLTSADLEQATEKIADEYRSNDGRQCYFYLESPHSVAIDQGVDKARGGSPIDIDGMRAIQLEKKGQCDVDVWLVPDDLHQQFTVDAGTCDRSLALAHLILTKLPE